MRLSTLRGSLNVAEEALAYATIGVAVGALGVAGLLVLCGWWSDRAGAGGAVAACSVPARVGVAITLAMARNRLTTSLQVLPGLLGDPFGSQGGPLARGTLIDPDSF